MHANGKKGSNSFADLRELQKQHEQGLIKVVTSEKAAEQKVIDSVAELSHLWATRLDYAKALIAAGVPDTEVMTRAEALAKEDHRGRCLAILELFRIHEGKVPDGVRYSAHMVGLDADAILKTPEGGH
jgi:hypothetical protein